MFRTPKKPQRVKPSSRLKIIRAGIKRTKLKGIEELLGKAAQTRQPGKALLAFGLNARKLMPLGIGFKKLRAYGFSVKDLQDIGFFDRWVSADYADNLVKADYNKKLARTYFFDKMAKRGRIVDLMWAGYKKAFIASQLLQGGYSQAEVDKLFRKSLKNKERKPVKII